MKTFILAGNANIAVGIADRMKIRRDEWKYVTSPVDFRGYSTAHVLVHSTVFRSFRWAQEAVDFAESRGFTIEHLPDDRK